jgi:hypothetical protein
MKSMIFPLFISVFYAVGLAILGFAFWSARRSTVASGWPTVPGTIESCSIARQSDNDGGDTYEVKVRYAYTVGHTEYHGSRLAFGYMSSSGQSAHQDIHAKLKNAKSVDVRYDPADPAVSTLSFGIHRSIQTKFAFALTWLTFVIGFTVLWWIMSRPDDVLLRNLIAR